MKERERPKGMCSQNDATRKSNRSLHVRDFAKDASHDKINNSTVLQVVRDVVSQLVQDSLQRVVEALKHDRV
jgi:hypothetical protein